MTEANMAQRVSQDRVFVLILIIVKAVNELFRILFRSGVWLDPDTARKVASLGLQSLRSYHELARIYVVEIQRPRFPIHAKYHMLFHTFRSLEVNSERCQFTESPLVDYCAQDEGFVGVIARYTRRVSPTATIDRSWDVYRASLHDIWKR